MKTELIKGQMYVTSTGYTLEYVNTLNGISYFKNILKQFTSLVANNYGLIPFQKEVAETFIPQPNEVRL